MAKNAGCLYTVEVDNVITFFTPDFNRAKLMYNQYKNGLGYGDVKLLKSKSLLTNRQIIYG